jgi:iron complex transport system substrate-binding protein
VNKKLKVLGIGLFSLLLVGCAGGSEARQVSGEETNSKELDQVVKIENGDHTLTFTEVPTRAISLNQHVTEVMLALGLEEHMVGTAYLDDEVLPEFKEAYDGIPVIADQYPSQEVFLDKEPDFAYAGWGSAFREDNIGTVEQLAAFGVQAYLHQSSTLVGPEMDDIFQDIRNVAKIFDVEERGEELINSIEQELTSLQKEIPVSEASKRIFVFDSGETAPLTVGRNFLNEIITMAGATNIFKDLDKNWGEVSFEEVVERDPEVIVVMDYGETTAEEKIEQLMRHPALTDVTAIKEENFIVMPLSAAAEGVRVGSALRIMIEGLY